jgi:hypothetical protein
MNAAQRRSSGTALAFHMVKIKDIGMETDYTITMVNVPRDCTIL